MVMLQIIKMSKKRKK